MNKDDVQKVILKMNLVSNINKPNTLKVSGTDIEVCSLTTEDDFLISLISEIKEMYRYLKMISKSTEGEGRNQIVEEIKEYIDHREAILAVNLENSKMKTLVED